MLRVIINGLSREFPEGITILTALHQLGIEVPTLCHDQRLKPFGGCRLCIVEVKGSPRPVTACSTPLADGMEIQTHSVLIEQTRRTLLTQLAAQYPVEAPEQTPDKEFHRYLRQYGATPAGELPPKNRLRDGSHPYINVDMTKCVTCFRCQRICEELQGQFVWRAWSRGNETHLLPDSGNTLAASSCVSCGACVDTCPTGALEDLTVLASGTPTTWTRTVCPYCGVGCEMNVGTNGDQIVQVKPVLDAPVNKGHLCVKGRYAFGFTHATDRITRPMIRELNGWREVSWKDAVDFTAAKLQQLIKEFGPDSIGILGSARGTNEENYLAQKFARVVVGTNNVDCCARVCHGPTALGMKWMLGTGAATNSFDDIEIANAFLLCGCNPTENHPIVGARIKQSVLRGAKLIVIDPRQTELARLATVHLQLHPGTNVALLNAMAHVIVEGHLQDTDAMRRRVADWDTFEPFIREWTPERAALVCGVAPDLIRQAARLYATHHPAMCFHGLGVTEHTQGTEGVMCLVNLALLTGNFGKPGSGVNPLRGQNNVQGSAHMGCEPGNLTGYIPIEQGRESFERIWQTTLPATQGLNLMRMIDAAGEQRLKAVWAMGYDVALTNPNARATMNALKSLPLVIVQDLFLNVIARECGSVFFPAASSFEKDGTFMNSERRVQRVRKAMEPPESARADWQIICDLARAMGHGEQFAFHSPEEIWDEVRSVWKAGAGISYARIEQGGLQWPCPTEEHSGTKILHTESFPAGQRASLRCIEFEPTRETVTEEFPFLLTTGRTLYQFNAGTMTMRTPNTVFREADFLDVAPSDAQRLDLHEGDKVRVRSRHGESVLPVKVEAAVRPGELFATFHTTEARLNELTSAQRDQHVDTPEYKVTAVNLEKL